MMEISEKSLNGNDQTPGSNFAASHILPRRIWKWALLLAVWIAFAAAFESVSFAQAIRSGSTTRGFLLWGDVRVDESQLAGQKPMILDVLLYTKGMQLVARQRISPNGRYKFMDIFDGDYWLVIELEGAEVVRDSVFIAKAAITTDIRHDLALEWRSTGGRSPGGSGVVSAANLYNRSASNKSLYEKSAKEIESKNYAQAIATLKDLVAADPKDFQAWADLGMLYFVQKDYEAAENCYASAVTAKPAYFPAVFNLGKVQLARKNFEQAIASLEAALKIEPKSAPANYFLGEAYLGIKKGSKAVVYLNEALSIDPVGMAEAHLRLAALYNGAGMKDKAAAEYEEFLKKKPDYPDRKKLEQYIADNKKP
jgi:tetratricopeptide (TPR) repeat protein